MYTQVVLIKFILPRLVSMMVLKEEPDKGESMSGERRQSRERAMASAGLEQAQSNLSDLEHRAADSNLWNNPGKAQETLLALTDSKEDISLLNNFQSKVEDLKTIIQLTKEMQTVDYGLLDEASVIVEDLNNSLDRYESTKLLSGQYDKENACLTISAGVGGADAQCRTGLICF